jgi:hypothetical protein
MRNVTLTVGGKPVGEGPTWAYPHGAALGTFLIPIYELTVQGTDTEGNVLKTTFQVYRFGVLSNDGKTASVVGLAKHQIYHIKRWIPTYKVHSANSPENGAWQVFGNFLIHDGPDDDTQLFATIGCIEIRGPQGFVNFNDLLISLMEPTGSDRDGKLDAIAQSGRLKIVYEEATRPNLKKAS